jgi:hypothetical protein
MSTLEMSAAEAMDCVVRILQSSLGTERDDDTLGGVESVGVGVKLNGTAMSGSCWVRLDQGAHGLDAISTRNHNLFGSAEFEYLA